MKLKNLLAGYLCLTAMSGLAQEANQVEKVNQQLKDIEQKFEKQQREMRENFEKLVREQQAQIDALKKQLEAGKTNGAPAAAPPPAAAPAGAGQVTAEQLKQLKERLDQVVEAQKQVRPNAFNPSIGLVAETVFSYRSKGSDQIGSDRPGGFDVFQRSIEVNVAASVDPFAKGYVVINAQADSATGEATLGVEEAALQTTSLPWNLELKAGRFFGEFGRLGYIHDHELPFVNRPLALEQYF